MHGTERIVGLAELTGARKIWFSDWYDGPRTGLAEHDGNEYWFVAVVDNDFNPVGFVLHRLAPAQVAWEWQAHREFAAAGLPGCLHTPPCPVADPDGREGLADLYARWPPGEEDDYENAPVVGWFRDAG